ncbi:MAG: hypothetical protein Kow00121_22010 [Elainellaceae cyanobacterium]
MRQGYRKQNFHWLKRIFQRYWIPLLLGIVTTAVVFGLWQQLLVQEQLHIEQLVQQEANAIESELNRDFSARIQALERMADRWQVSGGTPQALWEADAVNYFEQYYGFQAIEWVDPSFHVRWVVPLKGNESAQNLDLSQEPRRRITLQVARDLRQPLLTRMISLTQGGEGFLACIPLFVNSNDNLPETDRFDGFIVGVFRFQSLFDSILEASPEYQVQIFGRNGLIYSLGGSQSSTLSKIGVVRAYGADWRVQVSATPALIAKGRSPLPTVVLWGGLAVAWTIAFTVYLGQRSKQYAQQASRINQQLQAEISERRQTEMGLRHSEAANRSLSDRLELAVQSAQIGIWDWDIINDCLIWNDQMYKLYGVMQSDFAGAYKAWSSALHPDDFEITTSAIQQAVRGERDYNPEFRVVHPDGSIRYIQAHAVVQRDSQGRAQRMIGVNLDITDRKEAEEKLRRSEAALAEAQRMVHLGNWELDVATKQITWSDELFCMFGFDPNDPEPAYAEHFNYIHPDDRIRLEQNLDLIMTEGIPYEIELRIFRTDGSIGYMEARGEARYNHQGQIEKIFGTALDITDRKNAEVALAKTQQQFQNLVENSPDIIERFDRQLRHLYVSPALTKMTGIAPEAFVGKTCRDLKMDQVMVNTWETAAATLLETGEKQVIEFEAPTLEGIRSFEMAIAPEWCEQGTIESILCISRDITERKQAELALKLSRERLQLVLEASGDGLWDWNMKTGEIYHSPRYQEILGYEIDELTLDLQGWEQTIHPDDRSGVLERLKAHLQDNSVKYTLDYRVRCKSGDWKWITDYGKIVAHDLQGNPLRMIGAYKDISDRKQAETELKHQKNLLQTIVNHIPVMIALFNSEGRIEFVNPEFEQVLGWPLADWQQRDVLLECYPNLNDYRTVIDHMVAANGSWKDFTTRTKTGQQIETSWTNVQLANGSNLGIGQDVSDRKHKETILQQAMEAAEAANLAKSMFLANMSHELRTPLNVILGFAQLMTHDPSLTPDQREDLQTIQRSGDHLLSLINDILDLSKIEAGYCTLEEKGFDIISLLHTLRTMMAERAKVKQLQLIFDIAPEVPQFVIADEQKLRQVLLNLLSNAIKFTKQGSVTLRVTSQESHHKLCSVPKSFFCGGSSYSAIGPAQMLRFEIADTGVGIAAADQGTIFDAFVQAEAGKKSTSGTGLGLTISRKLLKLMGGEIAVDSVPTVGSTFTVTVPVCPTGGINLQPEQQNQIVIGLAPGQPHRRILVVDDQRENRLLMVRLLSQLGLSVQEAVNGQDAVQIWQKWQPDLTWMDIRMPILDGYEATRKIRAMEQGKASIIIALTAQASQSDRALALAAGCNDYISKPFREETVFHKMSEYLGLEYLYADSGASAGSSASLSGISPNSPVDGSKPTLLTLPDLSTLPRSWLNELEEAATCGNDKAIITLAAQLPPNFTQVMTHLTELANQFQFEQILNLVHRHLPDFLN